MATRKKTVLLKTVGGKTRMYLPTFDLQMSIPSVGTLIESPDEKIVKIFMQHVVLNHKGLNWKIYRYYLNRKNYKSFLYSFAYICKDFSTTHSAAWQVESNARRLQKALSRNKISLSLTEKELLSIALSFTSWKDKSSVRESRLNLIIEKLY